MKKPLKNESLLLGEIVTNNGLIEKDYTFNRIEWLISEYFNKVDSNESGWEVLFQDPEDKRYWELSYPDSELHGGGRPQLKLMSTDEARLKFNI